MQRKRLNDATSAHEIAAIKGARPRRTGTHRFPRSQHHEVRLRRFRASRHRVTRRRLPACSGQAGRPCRAYGLPRHRAKHRAPALCVADEPLSRCFHPMLRPCRLQPLLLRREKPRRRTSRRPCTAQPLSSAIPDASQPDQRADRSSQHRRRRPQGQQRERALHPPSCDPHRGDFRRHRGRPRGRGGRAEHRAARTGRPGRGAGPGAEWR